MAYFDGAAADITDENVIVLTGASYASVGAAEDAVVAGSPTANQEAYYIFLNSTLGYAQVYYDADSDTDGTLTASVINLTGITTLAQLAAAFNSDSFVV